MDDARTAEAVGLLRRLRERAASWSVERPTIRGLGSRSSLKTQLVATRALRASGYWWSTERVDWVAAIDRAIASLALGGAA